MGYTKYQSNIERHRTYIGSHRVDIDYSAKYAAMEDTFCTIAEDGKGDIVYKMDAADKVCLDSFMRARNGKLLWSKGSMDENGHSKIQTYDSNRPIVATEGLIPQLERFAEKFVFVKPTIKDFNQWLMCMVQKSERPQGNQYVFLCNTLLYNSIQQTMSSWIRDWKTVGTFVFSKAANGYVELGATFQSYEFSGNTVCFRIERDLDIEFPNRMYGVFVDLTADAASGNPALAQYTFKGMEFLRNVLVGVGGIDGKSSGTVSSPVAASKIIMTGYARRSGQLAA